jgi:hypothetical protein
MGDGRGVALLRSPSALSQALADSLGGRDALLPWIEASPEAFSQRSRDLRSSFNGHGRQPPTPPNETGLSSEQRRHADLFWLPDGVDPGGRGTRARAAGVVPLTRLDVVSDTRIGQPQCAQGTLDRQEGS